MFSKEAGRIDKGKREDKRGKAGGRERKSKRQGKETGERDEGRGKRN